MVRGRPASDHDVPERQRDEHDCCDRRPDQAGRIREDPADELDDPSQNGTDRREDGTADLDQDERPGDEHHDPAGDGEQDSEDSKHAQHSIVPLNGLPDREITVDSRHRRSHTDTYCVGCRESSISSNCACRRWSSQIASSNSESSPPSPAPSASASSSLVKL